MPFPLLPPAGSSGDEVTVDVDELELLLELESVSVGVGAGPGPGPDEPGVPDYSVRVVDFAGVVLGELEHANVGTVARTLNAEEEFSFTSPKFDPATELLERPLVEVQVLRRGKVRAWGPVVSDNASSGEGAVGFSGRGVYWYFRKRFFGTAQRTNMLSNGDFEDGDADGTLGGFLPGWTTVGDVQRRHWTAATKPGGHGLPDPLRGTKAISLASDTEGADGYVRTRFEYRTEFPPGQRLTFAAWVYIADDWIGPAALNLGLYAERVVGGIVETRCHEVIDDDTPRGEWVRLEASMIVRPHRDGYVEVRLYSPAGWVVWDESLAVLMESTGAGFTPTDQVELAGTIVRYGQTGRGKSDLAVGTSTPATGVLRKRAWQHADHDWLADAVEELGSFTDGFDSEVLYTPTTRTFRTFFPRKGTDRSETVVLSWGVDGATVAAYSRSRDGSNVATSIVSRGRGEGPDREEGGALDASEVDGLILEAYVDAPEGLPIGELDDVAANELEARKEPIEVLELTVTSGGDDLIDLLETGDVVYVRIDDGYVQVDGPRRIVRLEELPSSDALKITTNREPD